MYEKDGVCYAGVPTSDMKVTEARVVDDLSMLVLFSTGETRLFDATPLLGYPAFKPLANRSIFNDFEINHGIVCWLGGELDLSPANMYELSYSYESVA